MIEIKFVVKPDMPVEVDQTKHEDMVEIRVGELTLVFDWWGYDPSWYLVTVEEIADGVQKALSAVTEKALKQRG
jgi:hypothetical protein